MKKQLQPPAPNNKTKLDNNDIQKQQQLEQERIEAIRKRRRAIYEAICALIDPVTEEEMLDQLQVLDVHAWAEVVEERFLGRLCGYPVCSKNIKVDFRRKYVLLRRETRREFVSIDSEPYKFCSDRCMCMARAVAGQLDTEEQSIAILRLVKSAKPKQFQLPTGDEWKQFLELDQDDDEEE